MVAPNLEQAEKATILSSLVILSISTIKFVVGFFSNSIVLMTDALHSFTDLITNFASWIGLKISQRKPDEKFPYGYFRAESFSAFFISFFIIFLALSFLLEGFRILEKEPRIENPVVSLLAALLSIITSYGLYKYLVRTGKITHSQALIANGNEKKVDILTSSVVFITLLLSFYQIMYIEGVVTILISILILKVGIENLKESIYSLMDVSPSKEVETKVIKSIASVPGVEGFGDLKLRKSGPFVFGEVDVMIRKHVSVQTSRKIGEDIENEAKKRIEFLNELIVRVIPYQPEQTVLAIPFDTKNDTTSNISEHFGRSKYIKLVTVSSDVVTEKAIENQFKDEKIHAGLHLSHFLVSEGVDYVITREIGEISFHVLRDHLIDVIIMKETFNYKTIINKFIDGDLKSAERPTKSGREYWES